MRIVNKEYIANSKIFTIIANIVSSKIFAIIESGLYIVLLIIAMYFAYNTFGNARVGWTCAGLMVINIILNKITDLITERL